MALGAQDNRPENDVSRLSDAELIRVLAAQAEELGVKIDLSYDFGQQQPPATDGRGGQPIDTADDDER